ncbi:MAG: hypothetical protein LBS89_05830 [Zoogloeaceae bacterium]|nr:hypothetical protein [Zoogloeaceae bacterium]
MRRRCLWGVTFALTFPLAACSRFNANPPIAPNRIGMEFVRIPAGRL